MIVFRTILLAATILTTGHLSAVGTNSCPNLHQDEGETGQNESEKADEKKDTDKSTDKTPPAAAVEEWCPSEAQLAVWSLEARTVARRFNLSDEIAGQLVEAYRNARVRHARAADSFERRWLAHREQVIREGRQFGGEVGPGFFDRTWVERSTAKAAERGRREVAEALIELLERPQAEQAYPMLAAFDAKVDGMVNLIIEFGIEEDDAFKAVESINAYFIARARAAELVRRDRRAWSEAVRKARDDLMESLSALLSEEQLAKFARYAAIRRGGRG